MTEITAIWDQRYSKSEGAVRHLQYEPWLDRWLPVLARRPGRASGNFDVVIAQKN